TVVWRGGQKQPVLEPGRESLDGAGDLRVNGIALATRRRGVMRLVQDEHGAGTECPQPVAERPGIGLVDEQPVGDEKTRMGSPGIDAEASLAANPCDEILVEDFEW